MEDTGTSELMHVRRSYCTSPGATIPARISPPAAICGMLHFVPSLTESDSKSQRSCRDGVKKPPLTSRQRDVGPQHRMDLSTKKKARQATVNDSVSGSKNPSLVKASPRCPSASLRQLEALHKSSGTGSRLKIHDGKRIKLFHNPPGDGVQHASTKTKTRPNFDMDFSILKEDGDGVTRETCLMEASDSEELPEPHELVRASVRGADEADEGLASRVSDYSDSDIDALIRDAHPTSIPSTGIDSAVARDISESDSIQRTIACKGRKDDCTVTTATRTTREATLSAGITSPRLRPQVRMHERLEFPALINDQKRPLDTDVPARLFDSDSDLGLAAPNSLSAVNDLPIEEENFVLDKSLFDFLGSETTKDLPVAPSLHPSSPTSPVNMQDLSTVDFEEPSFYANWKAEQRQKYGEGWNPVPDCPVAGPEFEHDHLADFEEWLATTDSIEFIN
jgi:hypothetical protein